MSESSNWFLKHPAEFTVYKWTPQSPELHQIKEIWDVVEQGICIVHVQLINLQQLHDAIVSKSQRIVSSMSMCVFEKEGNNISWNCMHCVCVKSTRPSPPVKAFHRPLFKPCQLWTITEKRVVKKEIILTSTLQAFESVTIQGRVCFNPCSVFQIIILSIKFYL